MPLRSFILNTLPFGSKPSLRFKKLFWSTTNNHLAHLALSFIIDKSCTFGLASQLILQWSIGIIVLMRFFLGRRHFDVEIMSKLGSSFSLGPFIVVLGSCTILAMVATLPLGQLFFFHILLIKKGVSTYDYIVAMRE